MKKKRARIIYWNSGSGIDHDCRILKSLLIEAGFEVQMLPTTIRSSQLERIRKFLSQRLWPWAKVDLQLHLEQLHHEQFSFGKENWLFINPEWTDVKVFKKLPPGFQILAKTEHAKLLLKEHGIESHYTGFTSEDRFLPEVKKDYRRFLHVPGLSDLKGTDTVYSLWSQHPEWPTLTIVRRATDRYGQLRPSLPPQANIEIIDHWLSEKELTQLKNECGIHVCPSEAEGFGHVIMEALSTGAVVLTTDAPPMNELVEKNAGFHLNCREGPKQFMVSLQKVDAAALESAVGQVIEMREAQLTERSALSRSRFKNLDASFRERFHALLGRIV
jgi:glycosyltransferase involved in cell wall biosynthesis